MKSYSRARSRVAGIQLPPDDVAPFILAVGPLPPPMHGAAAVTAAVWSDLSKAAAFLGINTATQCETRLSYHLDRLKRHCQVIPALVRNRDRPQRLLYFTCPGGSGLWYLVFPILVARVCRYKIAFHHHSYAYLNTPSASMRLIVLLGGRWAVHFLLCDSMRTAFCSVYPSAGLTRVCSNAAWIPSKSRIPPVARDRFTLGLLSRLTEEKGLKLVLAMLRRLVDSDIDAELRLAGSPGDLSDQRILDEASLEFGDRLTILGPLAGKAKEDFYASIDIFIFPTSYEHEAEPLVILEALGAGVPVTTFGRGCINGMVSSSAGFVVRPGDDFVGSAAPYLCELATRGSHPDRASQALADHYRHLVVADAQRDEFVRILVGRATD